MADREITLDDLWTGNVRLANVAAQLLTVRADADDGDSIWAGDLYGSAVVSLATRGGASLLVRREVERAVDVVGVDGVVESFSDEITVVRMIDTRIAITASAVTEVS